MTTISETDQELETLAQQVDAAWSEVQKLADGDRSKATDLRQAIEAFHKAGLTRIVRRLKEDPQGKALLFELVDDPLVYALFSMHGIVRADLTTRVSRVVDMVRPYMRSHGGDVELAEVRGTTAFVRLSGACNGCSMSAVTLRNTVEEALREHVPEITAVEVVPNEPGPALIMPDAIGVAGGRVGWVQGLPLADVPPGTMRSFEHNGTSVLIVNLENKLSAFRNECAHQGRPLDGGMLDPVAGTITCPWHGFCFDGSSGECFTAPQAQLEPFPLRVEDGYVWVRV